MQDGFCVSALVSVKSAMYRQRPYSSWCTIVFDTTVTSVLFDATTDLLCNVVFDAIIVSGGIEDYRLTVVYRLYTERAV